MAPPLMTRLGRTPKKAGSQSTRSASFPTSTDPTWASMPCATAGLIVYFATYRRARSLSAGREAPRLPRRSFITWATCQVRVTTSPIRPMAWASEEVMDRAPRSCRTSSAAIVVARMRDSAKARSSGTSGLRWWHTISMSRCSATVFTVCGSVGLVEPGMTCGWPATVRMSGAWPPPAPSAWKAWIDRPAMAARVDSTKPASLRLSECSATCRPQSSAARRAASMAAGVEPQSSCTL